MLDLDIYQHDYNTFVAYYNGYIVNGLVRRSNYMKSHDFFTAVRDFSICGV